MTGYPTLPHRGFSSWRTIPEKVKDIIEKELGVEREKLTGEASFIEDLGADSLDIVELVMEFEKEFNIDIPDEDAEEAADRRGRAPAYLNAEDRRLMKRRVVVTGIGCVTPVGNDVATTWAALLAGKSGTAPITKFDAAAWPVRFACELKGSIPSTTWTARKRNAPDQYAQYAMAAARHGHEQRRARRAKRDWCRIDTGVIIGSGIGGLKSFEEQHDVYRERGVGKISPFFIPMFIADIAAGIVSMRFGAKGPNYATVSACATSAHAIGDAYRTIQYGDADIMITGGAEATVTPMAIGGFANMKALSERNDSPETASRPFDATRDGFVMGEGAAVVILEGARSTRPRRNARIYSEIVGYGATGDAYHLTAPAPDGEGAQRAMKRALKDAGLEPKDIQYINAHGTSTPANDFNETRAIKAVFGDHASG